MQKTVNKKDVLVNFRKAHSLLAKVIKMAEEDKYCIDLIQQSLAAIGLLKSANQKLLSSHLNSCFKAAMMSSQEKRKQDMIEEILKVTKLSQK